eukprot:GHVQ01020795.1.p2 GENE.GHVQ01020795.1~~GHVQ01020795.1.p2  ORF type:complete len:118 (-),score=15.79 GHVQ01020795.1:136-489(-)
MEHNAVLEYRTDYFGVLEMAALNETLYEFVRTVCEMYVLCVAASCCCMSVLDVVLVCVFFPLVECSHLAYEHMVSIYVCGSVCVSVTGFMLHVKRAVAMFLCLCDATSALVIFELMH